LLNATVQKIVGVPVARQHSLNIHKFRVHQLLGTGNIIRAAE